MQAVSMNNHYNGIYMETKCVSAFGTLEDDLCRNGARHFTVDKICLAVVNRRCLPRLPEMGNA